MNGIAGPPVPPGQSCLAGGCRNPAAMWAGNWICWDCYFHYMAHKEMRVPPEEEKTYEITESDSPHAIKCLVCGLTSYHPEDVKNRYCGNCHKFHEDEALRKRVGTR